MKLYEFEGKALFDRAGIKTPLGKVVLSPEEASGLTQTVWPRDGEGASYARKTRQGARRDRLRQRGSSGGGRPLADRPKTIGGNR